MPANKYHSQIKTYGRILFLPVLLFAFMASAKTVLPVFILAGQSNMVGYFSDISILTADQKTSDTNAKIYMNGDGDASKKGSWQTLATGFGATTSYIGPELFFGKTLTDSVVGKKVALIKYSIGGTYLGKSDGWLPPSSNNGTGGTLYNNLISCMTSAMNSINTAFDTSKYTPKYAGFVWLQGEFDAYDLTLSNAYATNLKNLISDIRTKVNVSDLPVILPLIDTLSDWTYYSIVRAADVAMKQQLTNVDTLETKYCPMGTGSYVAGLHYNAKGQVTIGTVSAQRWLAMNYNYGQAVPVAYRYSQKSIQQQAYFTQSSSGMLFDVSGRRIMKMNGQSKNVPFGIFITNSNHADAQYRVILNSRNTR
jgi:hypothetical protein